MTQATIGAISSGTMRPEDLIPTFTDELRSLDTDDAYSELIAECDALDFESVEGEVDDIGGIVDDLFDALQEFSPPYCYFGAHEGDGACYGFWPMIDQLEEDSRYGEVLKVNDLSDVKLESEYVMHVSDHGNVTLYRVKNIELEEIWAIV